MRLIVAILIALAIAKPCMAWSEGGHRLIAVMAYGLLNEDERQEILATLMHHPRYAADFNLPTNLAGPDEIFEWLIGRAAYWPDLVRSQPQFNRTNWHLQPGATLKFGAELNIPKAPVPLPKAATLNSPELSLSQAIELCQNILRNKSAPATDRALALCWLLHLVADAHHPCNAGSLYMVIVFPEGDRWASLIPTKQAGNLYAFWDGLLGQNNNAAEIRLRAVDIQGDQRLWTHANDVAKGLGGLMPKTWLAESAEHGKDDVYAPEVLTAVDEAMNRSRKVTTIDLSPAYMKNAAAVARKRAAYAAHRLAPLLRESR